MAAPTFVTAHDTIWSDHTTNPKAQTFTPGLGNSLVALMGAANSTFAVTVAGGPTWTAAQSQLTGSNCAMNASTAIGDGASDTVNVAMAGGSTSNHFGGVIFEFTNSDGLGASASATNIASTHVTLAITTTQDNSAIAVLLLDFNAVTPVGRAWDAINGIVPTVAAGGGNGFELTPAGTIGDDYTVVRGYYPDAGLAGAKTVGVTTAGTMRGTIVAVEVKGNATSAVDVTVDAVVATATAAAHAPAVSATRSPTVTAVAATASGLAAAPAVSATRNLAVTAVKATATAAAAVPVVDSTVVTSGGGPATASGSMPAPSVSVTGSGSVNVSPPAATASGSAHAPVVATTGSASATAVAATASGLMRVPAVSATRSVTVAAVKATASAQAVPPTHIGVPGQDVTVVAPVATGSASLIAPAVDVENPPAAPVWLFTPPMRTDRHRLSGSLFYKFDVSSTVWFKDGVWQFKFFPLDSDTAGGILLTNTGPVEVDEATAMALEAAGIGTVELVGGGLLDGLSIVDNGDGTFTISGDGVTINPDGTASVASGGSSLDDGTVSLMGGI